MKLALPSTKTNCSDYMTNFKNNVYSGPIIAESMLWVKQQPDLRGKVEMGLTQEQRKGILKILSILHVKFPNFDSELILDKYNKLFRICL